MSSPVALLKVKRNEREMKLISLLAKCNLKGKYKDIQQLRTEVIKQDLDEYFYSADFMAKLFCIFDTILLAPVVDAGGFRDANAHITEIFTDLRRIGAESANGVALMSSLGSSKDLFVIKAPKDLDHDDLFHELFVGVAATNSLRKLIPNYAYIFGGFRCLPPSIAEDKHVVAWCERAMNPSHYVNYVIYEKVPGKSLEDHCKTCTFEEYFGWFVQIVLALQIGKDKVDFTHYDAHAGNFILRDVEDDLKGPSGNVTIPYEVPGGKTWWVQSKEVAVMIDFGMSHVKVNGEHFGTYGFEGYGIFPDQSRPMYDLYKLIMFSLILMLDSNKAVFEQAVPLVQIIIDPDFQMSLDEIKAQINKEYDNFFAYSEERLPIEDEFTLWDYLDILQERYPDLWAATVSTSPQEGAKPLTCDGMCPTPGQFEHEITLDAPTKVNWSLNEIEKNPESVDAEIAMTKLPAHIRKLREEMTGDFQSLSDQLDILNSQSLQGIPNVMADDQFIDFVTQYVEPNLDFRARYEVYLSKLSLLEEYYRKKRVSDDVAEFQFGLEIDDWKRNFKKVYEKLNRLIVPASDQDMQDSVIGLMRG